MFDDATITELENRPSTYEHRFVDMDTSFFNALVIYKKNDMLITYRKTFLDKAIEDSKRVFFDSLVDIWLADTKWQSSMSRIVAHPSFSQLRGMGDVTVKFMLERMRAGDIRLHWFPLLFDIAKHDPVPVNKCGFVPDMAAAWIKWGEDTGRI